MKTVTVMFPVTVVVESTDTVDTILNQAAYILETTSIKPIILSNDGLKIISDEDLQELKTN